MSTIQRVVSFSTASPKRNEVLVRAVAKQLKSPCKTRWVETYQSISNFADNYPGIIECLEDIEQWRDPKSSSGANVLISAIGRYQFIVTLYVLRDVFSITVPVSAALQNRQLDVRAANDLMRHTIEVLQNRRENAESCFAELFASSSAMATELD